MRSTRSPAPLRTLRSRSIFQPFYSFKHAADREQQQAFWYATRRPSQRKGDTGTEVYLSLVDLQFSTHPAGSRDADHPYHLYQS